MPLVAIVVVVVALVVVVVVLVAVAGGTVAVVFAATVVASAMLISTFPFRIHFAGHASVLHAPVSCLFFFVGFLRPFFTRSRFANAPAPPAFRSATPPHPFIPHVCLLHFDLRIILRIVVRFTLELFFALTLSLFRYLAFRNC